MHALPCSHDDIVLYCKHHLLVTTRAPTYVLEVALTLDHTCTSLSAACVRVFLMLFVISSLICVQRNGPVAGPVNPAVLVSRPDTDGAGESVFPMGVVLSSLIVIVSSGAAAVNGVKAAPHLARVADKVVAEGDVHKARVHADVDDEGRNVKEETDDVSVIHEELGKWLPQITHSSCCLASIPCLYFSAVTGEVGSTLGNDIRESEAEAKDGLLLPHEDSKVAKEKLLLAFRSTIILQLCLSSLYWSG